LWNVCHVLVDSQHFDSSNYDHSYALYHAAAAGQAGLVEKLLQLGAWVDQLWSQASVKLEGCICWVRMDCDCCRDYQPSSHCPYPPALHTLQQKGHPLQAAAASNQPVVCSLLLKQGIHPGIAHQSVLQAATLGHLAALQVLVGQAPQGTSSCGAWDNPMLEAAGKGHKEIVELFLALGADLYNKPGTPWSAGGTWGSCLVAAVIGSTNLELVQLLLQQETMSLTRDWQKVLEVAARRGNIKLVRLLIDTAHAAAKDQPQQQLQQQQQLSTMQQHNEPGSKRSLPGWAQLGDALSMAAEGGHMGLVILLLHCGMDISQQALQSALASAAGSGRLEVAQLLFQYGADINDGASAFSEIGPLGAALRGRHSAVAEALLLRGAHAGFDALLYALQRRVSSRVVQLLLQRGVRDTDDVAIFRAAQAGQQDIVEVLLNSGKQSTSSASRRVMVARLEAAVCGAAMHAHLQLLQFLLAPFTKFLPGCADAMGHHIIQQVLNRGLQAAVQGGNYRWGREGQDPSYCNVGWTSEKFRLRVASFLLQQGADPNYENGQLLCWAVHQQDDTVLQELLRAGANRINLALELAAGSGHTSTVSLLLSATKGRVDSTGAALLSAASKGRNNIVWILLQRGANVAAALHAAAVHNNVAAATTIAAALHTAVRINNSIFTIPSHP
jgi:ankyrin repeat protein